MLDERLTGTADFSRQDPPDGSDIPNKGWYSRGYLPHADFPTLQFITFRLADSVPARLVEQWKEECRHLPEGRRKMLLWKRVEAYVDAGRGACWLGRSDVANLLTDHLLAMHGKLFDLKSWVIMPNHVHLLAGIGWQINLAQVMKQLKGASARDINGLVGRSGTLWFREYFDRYIRDEEHYANTVGYIERNPIKAGLCLAPEDWPFSSASCRLKSAVPEERLSS